MSGKASLPESGKVDEDRMELGLLDGQAASDESTAGDVDAEKEKAEQASKDEASIRSLDFGRLIELARPEVKIL